MDQGHRGERAEQRVRRAVILICAGLVIRMTVLCVGSGARLGPTVAAQGSFAASSQIATSRASRRARTLATLARVSS